MFEPFWEEWEMTDDGDPRPTWRQLFAGFVLGLVTLLAGLVVALRVSIWWND